MKDRPTFALRMGQCFVEGLDEVRSERALFCTTCLHRLRSLREPQPVPGLHTADTIRAPLVRRIAALADSVQALRGAAGQAPESSRYTVLGLEASE